MSTKIINIEKKRGDTRRIIFTIYENDEKAELDEGLDVSLWTSFVLTVDPAKDPADNTNNLEAMTGAFITDGTNGKVGFSPSGTIDPGSYFYDAQAIDNNGEKITFVEGKYKVTQDIGKA